MGFDAGKVYRLKFEDEDLARPSDGEPLLVRVWSASLGEMLKIAEFADFAEEVKPADLPKLMPLFDIFGNALIEWNVELRGKPVPANTDGLLQLDPGYVMRIIDAWQDAVAGVPAPLAQPSRDGATSEVPPIPMVPLSASQAS